jgi:hypothetical protein
MITLAWARLRHRPARGLLIALPATALGLLAEPSALFGLACGLYLVAAALLDGDPAEPLRTLSWLGWPPRDLAGVVLAGYGLAGLLAVVLAVVLTPLAAAVGPAPGVVSAALIAIGLALAAGAGCATATVRLLAGPEADSAL